MSKPFGPSLWPREHGAYAQLGVALVCALALAPALRSASQGLLTATLFLGSEPILVLLGRRGEAAPGTTQRAWRRLGLLGLLGAFAGTAAWSGAPVAPWKALLPAGALGLGLFGLFLLRQERTLAGELLAAWAFAATALPITILGRAGQAGVPITEQAGLALACLLAAIFTLGTTLVHGHLLALRRGNPSLPRLAATLFGLALSAVAGVLTQRGLLPAFANLALLPMTLATLAVWLFPPAPRHLKAVGWAVAFCALAGGTLAVVYLR